MSLIRLDKVVKRFGAVEALRGVDLTIESGEVIGLVGDNGAGKSTLFKILAGVHTPDEGEMRFEGSPVRFSNPIDARKVGIEIVYQDLALCNNLNAALNIFLGRELVRGLGPIRFLDEGAMRRKAQTLIKQLEVNVNVNEPVRSMSGGQRQAVAIARALLGNAKVILLDEPTAAISITAVEQVLKLINQLKAQGHTVVIVSHRMSDIFEVCDRVVVMRHGQNVASKAIRDTTREEVTGLITGAIAYA